MHPRRRRPRGPLFSSATLFVLIAAAACGDEPPGSGDPPSAADEAAPSADGTLVDVPGTRLFVVREGSGDPALVVHGGPVLDHGYLRPWLSPLGESLELVYFDQRLSGRSDATMAQDSLSMASFVADIEALRVVLDFERIHLIGHSWGGLLALRYALAHPERLHSLILLDPMAPSAELWQEEEAEVTARLTPADTAGGGELRTSAAFQVREPAAVEAVLKHSFRTQFHDPALADTLAFHIAPDYAERSRAFGTLLPELQAYDLVPELEALDVPVLLVYGDEEPGARVGGAVLSRALPRAELVTIPEAGHFPFIERPEAFLATVRAFLERVTTGGR